MHIGQKIRKARLNAGLRQKDLACILGHRHENYISRLENGGVRSPGIMVLKKLCTALAISLDSLRLDETAPYDGHRSE